MLSGKDQGFRLHVLGEVTWWCCHLKGWWLRHNRSTYKLRLKEKLLWLLAVEAVIELVKKRKPTGNDGHKVHHTCGLYWISKKEIWHEEHHLQPWIPQRVKGSIWQPISIKDNRVMRWINGRKSTCICIPSPSGCDKGRHGYEKSIFILCERDKRRVTALWGTGRGMKHSSIQCTAMKHANRRRNRKKNKAGDENHPLKEKIMSCKRRTTRR